LSTIRNILLLSVEDLNDWITPLGGHPDAHTPNLARLAARGFCFDAAYAPSPACSPSRTAALFGQGPWRTGIYGNEHSWAMAYRTRRRLSIIGRAKDAGWRTVMAGKVYHTVRSGQDWGDWDKTYPRGAETFAPVSQAVKAGLMKPADDFGPAPPPPPPPTAPTLAPAGLSSKDESPADAEPTDEGPMDDDRLCEATIAEMSPGAEGQFWAHGIYRPHLPFIAPSRFFDLVPQDPAMPPGFGNRAFDPADETEFEALPTHANAMSRRWTGRILAKTGEYKDFLRAYLAFVAYADHLVGRLLDHLDATGLSKTTLIVLWSDHGWQFGEKLAFRKFSLWERALRVPLMMAGPGVPMGRSGEPVSLLDIYPTLLEVIGGSAPHALDGQSLWPLLRGEPGRGYALSAFRVPVKSMPQRPRVSLSARSQSHRLIRYFDGTGELYDHRIDPFEKQTLVKGDVPLSDQVLPDEAQALMNVLPDVARPKSEADLPAHKRP